jgi:hypothetical protein
LGAWDGLVNYFYLQGNLFSGNLSSFLDNILGQATTLDLSNNAFSGELPLLTYANWNCNGCKCLLNLQNNFLVGPVSEAFCGVLSAVTLLEGNCLSNTTVPSTCSGLGTCSIVANPQRTQCS